MAIILRLDQMMADRKISLNDLAEQVGIANVNLSKIKTGKVSTIRFSTLESLCDALDCQPGGILEHKREPKPEGETKEITRTNAKKKRDQNKNFDPAFSFLKIIPRLVGRKRCVKNSSHLRQISCLDT